MKDFSLEIEQIKEIQRSMNRTTMAVMVVWILASAAVTLILHIKGTL